MITLIAILFLFYSLFIKPYGSVPAIVQLFSNGHSELQTYELDFEHPQETKVNLLFAAGYTVLFFILNYVFSFIMESVAPTQYAIHMDLATRMTQGQSFTLWEVFTSFFNLNIHAIGEVLFVYIGSAIYSAIIYYIFSQAACALYSSSFTTLRFLVNGYTFLIALAFCAVVAFFCNTSSYYNNFLQEIIVTIYSTLKKIGISFTVTCVGATSCVGSVIKFATKDRSMHYFD